jgi:hypothetical protein
VRLDGDPEKDAEGVEMDRVGGFFDTEVGDRPMRADQKDAWSSSGTRDLIVIWTLQP